MNKSIINPVTNTLKNNDNNFKEWSDHIVNSLVDRLGDYEARDYPLFVTTIDANLLWQTFLNSFETPELIKEYTCRCCEKFIKKYGNLVYVDKDGKLQSVIWGNPYTKDIIFGHVQANMNAMVIKYPIKELFMTDLDIIGKPISGGWDHLHFNIPHNYKVIWNNITDYDKTFEQTIAIKLEEFKSVYKLVTEEYSLATITTAYDLLSNDLLDRSEKVIGGVKFLYDIFTKKEGIKNTRIIENIVWNAIAFAPTGFCHPRKSLYAVLLDDIHKGVDPDTYIKKFSVLIDPLYYRRAQVLATEGNIKAAKELFEKLGRTSALRRRFARIDEIETIWLPKDVSDSDESVENENPFDRLLTKEILVNKITEVRKGEITFVKLQSEYLHKAESIEIQLLPHIRYPFGGITTQADDNALPILQWDSLESRNPFDTYSYHEGALALDLITNYSLKDNWHKVIGISNQPSFWKKSKTINLNQFNIPLILIEGYNDNRNKQSCIFSENLISELHSVRSAIEHLSKNTPLENVDLNEGVGGVFITGGFDIRVKIGSLLIYFTIVSID